MKTRSLTILSAAIAVALTSTVLADKPVGNNTWTGNSLLLPPHSNYAGRSYPEWAQQYWFWEVSILGGAQDFPGFDLAGNNLAVNQHWPVFFLPVSWTQTWNAPAEPVVFEERSAQIPAGKAIYTIVDGVHVTSVNDYDDPTWDLSVFQGLAKELWFGWSPFVFRLEIDGQVQTIDGTQDSPYAVATAFALPVPDGSAFRAAQDPSIPAVIVPFAEVNFSILVKPLAVGEHTIRIEVADGYPGGGALTEHTGIVWHITVTP